MTSFIHTSSHFHFEIHEKKSLNRLSFWNFNFPSQPADDGNVSEFCCCTKKEAKQCNAQHVLFPPALALRHASSYPAFRQLKCEKAVEEEDEDDDDEAEEEEEKVVKANRKQKRTAPAKEVCYV